MRRLFPVFLLFIVMLILAGCSSMKVMSNYDETVDFSRYNTYRFAPPKSKGKKEIRNPFFTKDMQEELRVLMKGKGFDEAVIADEADLILVFHAFTRNNREWVSPSYHVGRWGRVYRTSPGHVVNYKEGTLVIDIVDQQKKELVWQGIGQGILDRDNPAQNLIDAVQDVMESFPPEAK